MSGKAGQIEIVETRILSLGFLNNDILEKIQKKKLNVSFADSAWIYQDVWETDSITD